MKVLHVINELGIGGAEKLLIDMVPLIQQRGFDVDVLCLKDTQSKFATFLRTSSNGQVFTLSNGSVYSPLHIWRIKRYLQTYDLIHVHLFPALYWVVLAKWLGRSKVKVIFTEHSTQNVRMNYRFFRVFDIMIYSSLDKIITISKKVDLNLKLHLRTIKESKFVLIQNGVCISRFINSISYSKSDFFLNSDFVLIQVSAFREGKDQQTLIRSLTLLPEDIKLILVGEGPLRHQSETLTERLNINHRVKFLGIRTDIAQLLKMSDVAILSTRFEGLSLASIEGMSVRPFIGADVPGVREIVDGYGLLFHYGNEDNLAQKIMLLYNDKRYYDFVKSRCLDRATQFDLDITIDALCRLYGGYSRNKS